MKGWHYVVYYSYKGIITIDSLKSTTEDAVNRIKEILKDIFKIEVKDIYEVQNRREEFEQMGIDINYCFIQEG